MHSPPGGEWHHIAGSWDASTLKQRLFIDGIPVASLPTSFQSISYEPGKKIFIGGIDTTGDSQSDYELAGTVEEVRIWNIARSAIDIQKTMYGSLQANEEGLIFYLSFDNADSKDATYIIEEVTRILIPFLGDTHLVDSTAPVN